MCILIAHQVLYADEGEYLFNAAGCYACHTSEEGEPLSGSRSFDTPYGIFYSPNITPDKETGIGNWTRRQFIDALKKGRAPDGSRYYPAFPYASYQYMSDEDAGLIYDHLMSIKPVSKGNKPHELKWWLSRWLMLPWQFFALDSTTPPHLYEERGRYLVDALGHCGECHTPRNFMGILDQDMYLSGNKEGPDGEEVPNITPDREAGIGKWDIDDLSYYLESGEYPDGDYAGGAMADVIDHATSKLTESDRKAMSHYLKSLPVAR